ncbi:MAG TPA: helix-turn-helix domain-containing protein, partial [Candidatus Thermoplasmatota archaeon]|nr:helix-turn-helix domain-containing protein [Candidatus Thermoplasmatota archaeon]
VDLAPAARDGVAFRLSWAAAEGAYHWDNQTDSRLVRDATGGSGTNTGLNGTGEAPLRLGPGSLGGFRCHAECTVRLALGEGAAWSASGNLSGRAKPHGTDEGSFGAATGAGSAALRVPTRSHWLTVGADAPLRVSDAALSLSGEVELVLWGVEVEVDADGAGGAWRTGAWYTPGPAPGGALDTEHHLAWIALRLSDARIEAPVGAPFRLHAPSLDVALDGEVSSPQASGWIEVDGERREVERRKVLLRGSLEGPLDATGASLQDARAGPASRARMQGDVHALRIDGEPVVAASAPADPVPAAAVAVGAGAGLLLLAWLLKGPLAALYTRVTRSSVLAHPKRHAIYEHVRANPGTHVSEIARATGVERVVVQHHLRMLEEHDLVASRPSGRVLVYFLPDQVPQGPGLAAQLVLKDGTRLAVARAIRDAPGGVSQSDLVARTGLSQRLLSYHLRRLEEAGLVTSSGWRPRRFAASPALGALVPDGAAAGGAA